MVKNLFTAVVVILALLPGCTSKEKEEASGTVPDFTLQDLSGKKVTLSGQKGSVVLLEFWATWCPPCRASVPGIERLHEAYGGKGLKVLAVSLDEGGLDKVKEFVTEHKITYTVLKGTDEVSTKYRVRMIPATYLLDKQGVIRKQYLGMVNDEELEKDIKALL